jgi:hypothetical protein
MKLNNFQLNFRLVFFFILLITLFGPPLFFYKKVSFSESKFVEEWIKLWVAGFFFYFLTTYITSRLSQKNEREAIAKSLSIIYLNNLKRLILILETLIFKSKDKGMELYIHDKKQIIEIKELWAYFKTTSTNSHPISIYNNIMTLEINQFFSEILKNIKKIDTAIKQINVNSDVKELENIIKSFKLLHESLNRLINID